MSVWVKLTAALLAVGAGAAAWIVVILLLRQVV